MSVTSSSKAAYATALTVTTSEPIASSLAKVDGSYYTVTFGGTNTGTITGLNLDATKTHTLELINLVDKAGTPNTTVTTSKTFSVTTDTVAPTVTLSAKSDKQVLVTFSKSMDPATVTAAFNNVVAGLKDEALLPVNYTAVVAAVAGSNNTQFVLNVTDTLFTNKASRVLTLVLPSSITDTLGNAIAGGTQTVTLTKETVKPVATGYKIVKDASGNVTAIEVNFSEGLKAGVAPAAPTIVNMNGVAIPTTVAPTSFLGGLTANAISAGDTKVVYNATTPAKLTSKYAFSFVSQLVTDQSEVGNKSDAFNYTVDFGVGATAFSLPSAPTSAANVITVAFGRAVKGGAVANSATDTVNYTLGGQPLPAGTNIVLNATQDTATITLPTGTIAKTDGTVVFTAANVMSLNGELLNTSTTTLGVVDNVKPLLTSAVLNSDNSLTIGFSEALFATPNVADFVVTENGTDVALTALNSTITPGTGLNAGKYVLTVNTIGSDASGLFYDINGNATRDAGDVALTSVKFSTAATTTATDTATPGNVLTAATTITVK